MPAAPNRPGLWLGLAGAGIAAVALASGWWLGQWQRSSPPQDSAEVQLERQVNTLLPRVQQGNATPAEQQRLLELLVGLNRRAEATQLLEGLADRHPDRWRLRLVLAELRREQGDRSGAERELRQLLAMQPDQVEPLQLMALLQLESGRGKQATALVQGAFERALKPRPQARAVAIGLLLANLQQKQGQTGQAENTLMKLAADFPRDPRPLLARALIQQETGRSGAAQNSLAQARGVAQGPLTQQIDQMATAWGLASLRPTAQGAPQVPKATPRAPESTGPGNP